jgi:hypothetical protein
LLELHQQPAPAALGRDATSAAQRLHSGLADAVVPDTGEAVRDAVLRLLATDPRRTDAAGVFDACVARSAELATNLRAERRGLGLLEEPLIPGRQRDFFRYSFRGRWESAGVPERRGQVHASWGSFDGRRAMGIIVGPERSGTGIGIDDAYTLTRMIRLATTESRRGRPPIVIFLFCRGHSNELAEERAGLASALVECLRALVLARSLGHPIVCVLGGGAYGAAFLSLAAPSHRIIAIRGTSIAPMTPRVLAAFQRLRGVREAAETPQDLAKLIPEIRILESVVRLPHALAEEIDAARIHARRRVRAKEFGAPQPHRQIARAAIPQAS